MKIELMGGWPKLASLECLESHQITPDHDRLANFRLDSQEIRQINFLKISFHNQNFIANSMKIFNKKFSFSRVNKFWNLLLEFFENPVLPKNEKKSSIFFYFKQPRQKKFRKFWRFGFFRNQVWNQPFTSDHVENIIKMTQWLWHHHHEIISGARWCITVMTFDVI